MSPGGAIDSSQGIYALEKVIIKTQVPSGTTDKFSAVPPGLLNYVDYSSRH